MESEREAAEFRAAVRRAGPRGAGHRYPVALRQVAVGYFRRRQATGASVAAISRELGVKRHTLMTWMEMPSAPEVPRFVPVSVVDVTPSRIVVHGPGGIRVEGLDLAGLAELLRRLA